LYQNQGLKMSDPIRRPGNENDAALVQRAAKQAGEAWDLGALRSNTGQAISDFGSGVAEGVGQIFGETFSPGLKRLGGLLGFGAESAGKEKTKVSRQVFDSSDEDLRIKIKIPPTYLKGPATHLSRAGDGGIVFPYTPQMVIQQRANYNSMQPVHSNYPFYAYTSSAIDPITVVGAFTVQNQGDGRYVLGMIHALRTVTKMNFGSSSNNGAPPPVCRLHGYGDYMFNNLPVVVESFFYTLNEDVDYITINDPDTLGKTRVPTSLDLTVNLLPAFSRRDIAEWNIDDFAKGSLTSGKNSKGFL